MGKEGLQKQSHCLKVNWSLQPCKAISLCVGNL